MTTPENPNDQPNPWGTPPADQGWQQQPPPPPAPQPGWGGQQPQWGQQQPQYPQGPRESGKATAALVLGICGLVFCPLICSVIALVLGYQARDEIARSNGWITGGGSAKAGIVLGWIGVAISAFFVIIVIIVAATDPSAFDEAAAGARALLG